MGMVCTPAWPLPQLLSDVRGCKVWGVGQRSAVPCRLRQASARSWQGSNLFLSFLATCGDCPALSMEEMGQIELSLVRMDCESWGGCCNPSPLWDSALRIKTALNSSPLKGGTDQP